jgi:hypothetical protein
MVCRPIWSRSTTHLHLSGIYMYTYDKLHNQEWSWWTPLIYTSKPSILQWDWTIYICSNSIYHPTFRKYTHDLRGGVGDDESHCTLIISYNWKGPSVRFIAIAIETRQCSPIWPNGQGELPVRYKWTGWVWEITGWSSRLQENYRTVLEESIEYTPIQ